ncbi:MAG TPA: glycosyltransferase [Terriglobales bacterium]|nr:glycosyltransferase [Terriglobales bacterium]
MHIALMIGGVTSLAAWAFLLLARGAFWRIRGLPSPTAIRVNSNLTIATVIPARNEADVIARAVTSLLQQQIDATVNLILVDDSSDDGTAVVAMEAATALGYSHRLTVFRGMPLPPGWSGKVWAQQQGVEKALEFNPDYLLLTDGDIEYDPDSLALLVGLAKINNSDLTSFMVKLHSSSWFERWLIPAFVFFFFMLYPPAWISNPHKRTAGAAGGCMLLRPEALTRAGGLQAIRGEIIDDCSLARAVKATGGKLWLAPTEIAKSIRPYTSIAEIGRMISRTAFNQLGHSALLLIGTLFGLAIVYLFPVALLFSHHAIAGALGAASCIAMLIAYLPMIRFYHLNPAWALSLPLAAVFYMGATIHSAIQYWSGTGGMWKGRAQDKGADLTGEDTGHAPAGKEPL